MELALAEPQQHKALPWAEASLSEKADSGYCNAACKQKSLHHRTPVLKGLSLG